MADQLLNQGDEFRAILLNARERGQSWLDEEASKVLLARYGFAVPKGEVVRGVEAAAGAARRLRKPLVLKLISPQVVHKSDVGGVALGLASNNAVRRAASSMARLAERFNFRIDGFLLEEMVSEGHELLLGGISDPRFGPVVTVGIGGVLVEYIEDLSMRLCPISESDARQMLRELCSYPLVFGGARGRLKGSEDALVDAILRLGGEGGLLTRYCELIESIDINPLFLSSNATAADVRILLRTEGNDRAPTRSYSLGTAGFGPLFRPRTVAVAGASAKRLTLGNVFIRNLRQYGFRGPIYPIHPKETEIEGLPSYPDFASVPEPVDYAYVAIPPEQVPPLISGAANRVRFAQIVTSGFGESSDGHQLQEQLIQSAQGAGVRILGPNCLGTHSPRGRVTYLENVSDRVGHVGVISQSGGLSIDIARQGRLRGIEFSGIVTIGNSIDIGPSHLLDFYIADPLTGVIGIYIEDVKDGERFIQALRANKGQKPVVLLVGGQTRSGQRAAASHTGALATSERVWQALAGQTGVVIVSTLDEFLSALLIFQLIDSKGHRPTSGVVLFGNGGGASVLAADYFSRRGLQVNRLPERALAALRELDLPPGSSISNPIDTPVGTLRQEDGRIAARIIQAIFTHGNPDALVMHLNLAPIMSYTDQRVDIIGNLVQVVIDIQTRHPKSAHCVLVLRSPGEPAIEARRRQETVRLAGLGIPAFATLESAADAIAALAFHERHVSGKIGD